MRSPRHIFVGCITAAGFSDGDCVVVGAWRRSPLGAFVDVMWVRSDGTRTLLAPTTVAADYISGLYSFDDVRVVGISGGFDGRVVTVEAAPIALRLEGGDRDWRSWMFAARPKPLRRSPRWIAVEDRLARPFVGRLIGGAQGVRAAGTAPGGQREWYGVEDYRRVYRADLRVGSRNAGALASLRPDLGIGLSAFPTVPAMVHVTTIIEPVGH